MHEQRCCLLSIPSTVSRQRRTLTKSDSTGCTCHVQPLSMTNAMATENLESPRERLLRRFSDSRLSRALPIDAGGGSRELDLAKRRKRRGGGSKLSQSAQTRVQGHKDSTKSCTQIAMLVQATAHRTVSRGIRWLAAERHTEQRLHTTNECCNRARRARAVFRSVQRTRPRDARKPRCSRTLSQRVTASPHHRMACPTITVKAQTVRTDGRLHSTRSGGLATFDVAELK